MDNLKIYIDRLNGGQTQEIDETLAPDFLDISEKELSFKDPVHIKAEVYLADDYLIINLDAETFAWLPCSICNETVRTPITIKNFHLTQPLAEIKTAIFDLVEKAREVILLQTPLFTECNEGKCPERENIKKFLKPDEKPSDPADINYFPFADL